MRAVEFISEDLRAWFGKGKKGGAAVEVGIYNTQRRKNRQVW